MVCMAGGRLHAALAQGSLYAYFDTFVDLLINYEPFHFAAGARIFVGTTYTQDLLVISIPIHAEVAAALTLYGPPVSGRVFVDFWAFSFPIDFGSPKPVRQHSHCSISTA